ncbi:MAG TPA: hypothetical protein PLD10_26080, partial [Rhodopila sp.]|nr:hypothetical protein [Rhodopila sp.]
VALYVQSVTSEPAIRRALAKETDPAVKRRMEQARAAVVLSTDDSSEADRLAAIKVLQARGDMDARNILSGVTGTGPVAAAATAAVKSIDWVMQLWSVAQSVYYGISLGSVLLLAAAGLAITLIPVLMGYFIRGRIPREEANPLNRFLIALYRPILRAVLHFPKTL